jgi:hypothetical protein
MMAADSLTGGVAVFFEMMKVFTTEVQRKYFPGILRSVLDANNGKNVNRYWLNTSLPELVLLCKRRVIKQ